MAILNILQFPDPRLRTVAKPVTQITDDLRQLIRDMFETMYQAPGVGLAATQVNVHQRIIVVDVTKEQNQPYALINPEFTPICGNKEYEEGCLSVPGFHETVTRPDRILAKGLDPDGKPIEMECDGLLSVCIQHEIDHLNGKLFVDYLSNLKRNTIRSKLLKQHRYNTAAR